MRLGLIMHRHRHQHQRRYRLWLWAATAVVVVVAAGFTTWTLWPHSPTPRARQYLNVTACLLTGPSGVAPGTSAAPVWTAMQSASVATHVMVSYLPDTGSADAGPMLNALVQRRCGVIIATGGLTAEVSRAGQADPHQRFLLVSTPGARPARPAPNTVVVPAAQAPERIGQTLRALAAHAQPAGS